MFESNNLAAILVCMLFCPTENGPTVGHIFDMARHGHGNRLGVAGVGQMQGHGIEYTCRQELCFAGKVTDIPTMKRDAGRH